MAIVTTLTQQDGINRQTETKPKHPHPIENPPLPNEIPPTTGNHLVSDEELSKFISLVRMQEMDVSRLSKRSSSELMFQIQQDGQRGSDLPPDQQPVVENRIDQARYPTVVYTDDYLNDYIIFSGSRDFYPDVIPPEVEVVLPQYKKDIAGYTVVYSGNSSYGSVYSILAKSPLYNRAAVEKEIDMEFKEI